MVVFYGRLEAYERFFSGRLLLIRYYCLVYWHLVDVYVYGYRPSMRKFGIADC